MRGGIALAVCLGLLVAVAPARPEELGFDDGTPAAFAEWPVGRHGWGIRFRLPDTVISIDWARVFLRCPPSDDSGRYQLAVFRDSLGWPGEEIMRTPVLAAPAGDSGWQSVFLADTGREVRVRDSVFHVCYVQVGLEQKCPQLGRDGERNPLACAWQYRQGEFRVDSAPGDWMIRVWVNRQPPGLPDNDVRCNYIYEPWHEAVQRPAGSAIVPSARVENRGLATARDIAVACSVRTAGGQLCYTSAQQLGSLAPGQLATVEFDYWVPEQAGDHTVAARVTCTPDDVPQNDRAASRTSIVRGAHTGHDGAAYGWIDSDTTGGPVFDWVDTVGANIAIAFGDEARIFVPIGFAFPCRDTTFQTVYVCTNGWLSLGADQGTCESLPRALPDPRPPNLCLYPWWDNLACGPGYGGGKIWYRNLGSHPERRFALIWNRVNRVGTDTLDQLSFEVVLHENGEILFQYLDGIGGDPATDHGHRACVGMEDRYGRTGFSYVFARPPWPGSVNYPGNRLSDSLAIWIAPQPTGIAGPRPAMPSTSRSPTFVRGQLRMPDAVGREPIGELLDSGGRKVMNLEPGSNDVRALSPGVYFVRPGEGSQTRKVVIQN